MTLTAAKAGDRIKKAHADFGPSYAHIALYCPAAVTKTRSMTGGAGSIHARRGTAMHQAAYAVMMGQPMPKSMIVDGDQIELDDEMIDQINTYITFCELIKAESDLFWLEEPVSLDWYYEPLESPEPVYGTFDFGAYNVAQKLATMADFKSGMMPVSPVDNPQLMLYAVMMIGKLGGHEMPSHFRLVIVQPKDPYNKIKHHTITLKELLTWTREVLEPALRRVGEGDMSEVAGPWCQWCRRAGECRSLHDHALAITKEAFNDEPIPVTELSPVDLGDFLDKADIIESYLKTVRGEVMRRLEAGEDIPGWKAVAKRAQRKWIDEDAALGALLGEGLHRPALMTEPTLKSPAQVDKLLTQFGLDKKLTDPLVMRESSGLTIVRASDSRQKVMRLSASEMFPNNVTMDD
jgi:hypothetical protein